MCDSGNTTLKAFYFSKINKKNNQMRNKKIIDINNSK
jgi:hypothetical protein